MKTSDHQSEVGGSQPTSALHIQEVTKKDICLFLGEFHYLSKISKSFKCKKNFGLYSSGDLVGACVFTGFPVPELSVGMFGLDRRDQIGFWELSRLCLHPKVQGFKNVASWFTSRCLRFLGRTEKMRAVLSYADSQFHFGTVYQALGFSYYGLSEPKNDFFLRDSTGDFTQKLSRGPTTGLDGVWKPRSRKHRYLKIYDQKLEPKLRWKKMPYPKK